jgi:ElaB/YqjD/DUF883 family membrane-anchored ribosome-binding protein
MAERNDLATRMRVSDDEPERSALEIRQDIAAKRDSISETVDKLGDRIHETLDWREYIADYPYVALGVAAGLGFIVSGIFKRRPTPRDRIMDALAETLEDVTGNLRGSVEEVVGKRKGGLGKTAKAALTATITKAAIDFAKGKANEMLAGRSGPADERYAGEVDTSAHAMRAQSTMGSSQSSTVIGS